jgi:hypothetical protein
LVGRPRAAAAKHQGVMGAGLAGCRWCGQHVPDSSEPLAYRKSAARQGHGPQG